MTCSSRAFADSSALAQGRVEDRGRPAPQRQLIDVGHPVLRTVPPDALKLERDVDAPGLQRRDQVVELRQGDRVERLGIVAAVIEEATIGAERRIEIAEPDQVDARPCQAIGQRVGLLGLEEGGRGKQGDAEEPGAAPPGEGEPAVADGDEPGLPAGASRRYEASSADFASIVGEGCTGDQPAVSSST